MSIFNFVTLLIVVFGFIFIAGAIKPKNDKDRKSENSM